MRQQYALTLVHGTLLPRPFWRSRKTSDEDWTAEGSEFRARLHKEFSDCDVSIDRFRWSGRNRARDRHQAALGLAEHVTAAASRCPDARHVVIGHSHGGTIACLGLREPKYEAAVHAIVCLSTPFIHTRPRMTDVTWPVSLALPALLFVMATAVGLFTVPQRFWPLLVVVSLLAAFVAAAVTNHIWSGPGDQLPDFMAVPRRKLPDGSSAPAPSKALGPPDSHQERVRQRWLSEDRDEALLRTVRVPRSDRVRTLIVRVAGDEASGLLAFARFAAWLSDFAVPVINMGSRVAVGVACFLLAVAALGVIAAEWTAADSKIVASLGSVIFVGTVVIAGIVIGSVTFMVAMGLMTLALLPAVLILLFYGTDLLPLLTRFEFSVEETPRGRYAVEQLSFVESTSFSHSVAYEHAEVPPCIKNWLTARS